MQKIKWKGHLKQIFRQTAKIKRPFADQKKGNTTPSISWNSQKNEGTKLGKEHRKHVQNINQQLMTWWLGVNQLEYNLTR